MDITYLGHSCFKLRGREASLVTDPYASSVGFAMPRVSADIVTVSHFHKDHCYTSGVSGTARRTEPFLIQAPGEYEISGISVFGVSCFHDGKSGTERGKNTVFTIHVDDVSIVHLGDLGHRLSDQEIEAMGSCDILLVPVGGVYSLDPKEAIEVVNQLQPAVVIPMHYRTPKHNPKVFGKLATLEDFLHEGGFEQAARTEKLTLAKGSLPSEMEVVVLEKS
ncbi:MAG: hypothetical protein A2900_04610 [Candidatus Chisholmbacteria bacterium RIFCSPLOWO2_01_FULL_50_28]|uniref:Lactamase n=1 Tax=Candidatus Chisholmbacteria bacterium RIFCSPHIGHO2_01_FULL_52_32 TaxID=1797591 RepID=A0A1G1VSW3_9BACT|nr:MAG: hypothetical protein A2786_02135 [Candidatus Chisholmbacteria bacterium RIFCSPHIGHO2_01_FULL_52_32]OGY20330.1 MAG: hypothetical protein A2900_04610 [Candidatus Chisholmbacteria bacterium RIFCSPLOWO2_01_FULL_50_28]